MIKIVQSKSEIPTTHRAQLKGNHCPITGKSRTLVQSVIRYLPDVVAYLVEGQRIMDAWYNPEDLKRSAEAHRAFIAKHPKPTLPRRTTHQNGNGNGKHDQSWANVLASRSLHLEAIREYYDFIAST